MGMLRAQARRLGFIVGTQACLVACTLISDALLSSRFSAAVISVLELALGWVGLVATRFVSGPPLAFRLARLIPHFFAVCALGLPLVGSVLVLEKEYRRRSLSPRLVGHVAIILSSALISFLCWFVLSMAAFGIMLLVGAS
jgi:hypothetical protein